jgi:quinoprotein glucose dehydrogenase
MIRRIGYRGAGCVLAGVMTATAALPAEPEPAGPGGPPSSTGATAAGDWRYYAADAASTKYSALSQIDRANVGGLQTAWRWTSIDYELAKAHGPLRTSNMFETTPLAIDGVLYVGTGLGAAAAIDGATGKTRWVWNPFTETTESERKGSMGFGINRGLGSWRGPSGEDRLFLISHGHLVSLDAVTGKADAAFGARGLVDLKSLGEGREPYASYFWTSPPLVCRDVVVVGNSTTDPYNYKTSPPGTVRGYDVRTGKMLWARGLGGLHRPRQRVDLDELRPRARLRLRADLDADRRLVWRAPSRRRPLRREPGRDPRHHR